MPLLLLVVFETNLRIPPVYRCRWPTACSAIQTTTATTGTTASTATTCTTASTTSSSPSPTTRPPHSRVRYRTDDSTPSHPDDRPPLSNRPVHTSSHQTAHTNHSRPARSCRECRHTCRHHPERRAGDGERDCWRTGAAFA